MTLAVNSMLETVESFKEAGIRDEVKIIIGGNPATAESCELVGADAWARSPQRGVVICKEWAQAN